ncbi:integral membrane sensor signal transduction histidine kinase [Candidatus Magnetobacterium bavaricum]|uniref:histidine kinase n=1 Tax=Candidatus Magnetobacterium bavaricum TaxID=29290 RepID=A0A0F3GV27_9BACT|nr:integral membrane sensor signal transduction histidine kinase [Candidatus Magnetobacterium bavaricum]
MTLFNNYLMFHSIAEIFSIIVACSIFVVAYNSRRWMENDYLLFIGIASLFIAVLDMVHTLAYKGLGIFVGHDEVNRAASLWIAARYLESLSLLAAPLFFKRKVNTRAVLAIYSLILVIVIGAIVFWGVFPICFVDGTGLTPFKKISEYVISLILVIAFLMLRKNRSEFNPRVFRLMNYAIIVTILTEIMFTFYRSPYDIFNFTGHILKIVSFTLYYRAIVVTGIKMPFDIIFRQIRQREDELREINRELEIRVDQEVIVRQQKEQLLIQQSRMAAMGEMIGAIAHQWRQPLNAISVLTMDFKDAYDYGELNREYITQMTNKINGQVMFMSDTINDFRKFMQPTKEKSAFNVSHAIKDVLRLISFMVNKDNLQIKLECKEKDRNKLLFKQDCIDICECEDGFIVYGYPNEFKHAVLNLINNARDAILINRAKGLCCKETKGEISIELYSLNGNVRVEISDNGGGIPADVHDRLFTPYFTTKGDEKGTGIGLYMSRVIIENNMGGKLSCDNNAFGAVFKIDLKLMER